MARRRSRRDTRMGVGGMAGDLEYGERGIVESTAVVPRGPQSTRPVGPMPARTEQAAGMVSPNAAAADPFAPSNLPRQPINAGLEPGGMPEPDAAAILRELYRLFPYPGIRRLLERRDLAQEGPASRSMNTFGEFMDMANSAEGDSWMRGDMPGRVARNTMDRIGQDRPSEYFPPEGSDPDQSQMTPEQQQRARRQMDEIRRTRDSGRFAQEGDDPDRTQLSAEERFRNSERMDRIRRDRTGDRFAD